MVPVAALLAPDFATAIAIMATFGTARAFLAVVGSLTTTDIDARTSATDVRYQMLKRLAGAGSMILAAIPAAATFTGG